MKFLISNFFFLTALLCAMAHAEISDHFKKPINKDAKIYAMEGIDFIYVINLDERPKKIESVRAELAPFGITPYRFSAVDGWKLPLSVFEDVGLRVGENNTRPGILASRYVMVDGKFESIHEQMKMPEKTYFAHCFSRGAVAICLSHLSVLQDAYDSGYNTIWVMEDDIKVVKDPRALSSLIQKLDKVAPGWDILFTDRDTKNRKNEEVPCKGVIRRPNFFVQDAQYYLKKNKKINEEFSYLGLRYGVYSMIIRRDGMKKILDYFKTYKIFLPYDVDIFFIPGMKFIKLNSEIVTTDPSAASDNGGPNYLNQAH